ncbi:hypothetical protein ACFX2J_040587 [Malus domestica]
MSLPNLQCSTNCYKENRRDAYIRLMVINTRDHTTLQMAFTQGDQHLSKQCHIHKVKKKNTSQNFKRGVGRMSSVVLVSCKLVGRLSGLLLECLMSRLFDPS